MFFFLHHMRRPQAHASFFLKHASAFAWAKPTQNLIFFKYIFLSFSSARPTHKRNKNYTSDLPTQKLPHMRPFYVYPASACCVRFAWAWPTQDASNFLAHASFHLLPGFFRGMWNGR